MIKLLIEIENYLINNSNKIKINSKEIIQGDVFCALQGSKTHGNKYISNAINNGAKYIVTDKKQNYDCNNKLLTVNNIFNFLYQTAIKKRNQYNGKVIAITGSVGKTSIKELLKFFLSSNIIISASINSYNNYLGVLVSLINMDNASMFSIFEVGTNNFKEINKLSSLILPHQVIISNIYPTHLENFVNTRNVAIEKSDLINSKYNSNIEMVILSNSNEDEEFLIDFAKKNCIQSIITFGYKVQDNYSIEKIEKINNFLSNVTVNTPLRKIKFKTSTSFKHQILNMLIVIIIYDYNHLNIESFLDRTTEIPFIKGRGLFHNIYFGNKNIKLIDESYNASPASMKNCIEYFDNYEVIPGQRKIIVLGEMLELGEMSDKFHSEIVSKVIKSSMYIIIFCGFIYEKILAKLNLKSQKIFYFNDEKKILNFLKEKILKNDIILAKGSNSSKINKLVNKLLENNRISNC